MAYSSYVEEQASHLFERLFIHDLEVFSLIKELKRLKDSQNTNDNEVYHCTISNLYQEFRFLPQYPESELFSTAALTGALIENDLVPYILQDNFISKIKDCLSKPQDSKLYRFGIHSLQFFPKKIRNWPELFEIVQKVNSSILEIGEKSANDRPTNCDMVLVQLNNLTQSNVKEKASILSNLIEQKYFGWFCELCTLRAIQEPNYMDSYISLFQNIGQSQYEQLIRQALILVTKSFNIANIEKNHYKNLGLWVGKLTVAQNRPILWNELNLKELLAVSIKSGLPKQAISFICQILKQVCNTMLRPKNPWTMSIISILINSIESDSNNSHSKFELELLLRKLKLNASEIEQSCYAPTHTLYSEVNSLKEICLLACLISAKEFEDKIAKKVLSVTRATSSTLFEKDIRKEADAITCAKNASSSSLAYVLFKEFLRINSYSFLKRIFLELSVDFEDKDIWPIMIAAIEDASNFLFWCHRGQIQETPPHVNDLNREYGLFGAIMSDLPRNIELSCHWEKSRETLLELLIANIKSCYKITQEERTVVASPLSVSNLLENIHLTLTSLEAECLNSGFSHIRDLPPDHVLKDDVKKLCIFALSNASKEESGLIISQKLMQFLFKTTSLLFADILVYVLSKVLESSSRIMKEVTAWILHSSDSRKFNELAIVTLLQNGIVYILDFDIHLSRMIEVTNTSVVQFACNLCIKCLLEKEPVAAPYDMVYTLDALAGLQGTNIDSNLLSKIRTIIDAVAETSKKQNLIDKNNREAIHILFTEWFRISQYPSGSLKQQSFFVDQVCLKYNFGDKNEADLVMSLLLEAALDIFSKQLNSPSFLAYRSIDAFTKLVHLIFMKMKDIGARIIEAILQQIGIFLVRSIVEEFSIFIKPLSRIIFQLVDIINKEFKQFDGKQQVAVLNVLCQFFDLISPSLCPSFSLPWIELVCSRQFLAPVLLEVDSKMSATLMIPIITHIGKFFQQIPLNCSCEDALTTFYKGALHLFLIIAHDVPDIFVNNHEVIISSLPSTARQLRNLVLSSIPKSMKLPDPFSIKVSSLELTFDDKIELNHNCYKYPNIYISLLNAPSEVTNALKEVRLEAFVELCNVICDQLRYPSKSTTRNILLILSIYEQLKESSFREAVICCILERLVSHKPHPWGLMVTFLELIRNDKYGFWNESFINKSPEIRNLFDSIAKTCLSLKQ